MLALAVIVAVAERRARRAVVHAALLRAVAARLEIVAFAMLLRLPVVGLTVVVAETSALRLLGVRLRRRIEGLRRAFGRRGEAIEHAAVVVVLVLNLGFAWRAALSGELGGLRGGDQAKIMLGVLKIILRCDGIAAVWASRANWRYFSAT